MADLHVSGVVRSLLGCEHVVFGCEDRLEEAVFLALPTGLHLQLTVVSPPLALNFNFLTPKHNQWPRTTYMKVGTMGAR